jgi:hypothetical protein
MAHNLLRAAGSLTSLLPAKARAATIRRDLIAVAARTARHGRDHITLHLPEGRHREHEWLNLFEAACGPPAKAACPARNRSRTATPQGPRTQPPAQEPPTSRKNRQRQEKHALKTLADENG